MRWHTIVFPVFLPCAFWFLPEKGWSYWCALWESPLGAELVICLLWKALSWCAVLQKSKVLKKYICNFLQSLEPTMKNRNFPQLLDAVRGHNNQLSNQTTVDSTLFVESSSELFDKCCRTYGFICTIYVLLPLLSSSAISTAFGCRQADISCIFNMASSPFITSFFFQMQEETSLEALCIIHNNDPVYNKKHQQRTFSVEYVCFINQIQAFCRYRSTDGNNSFWNLSQWRSGMRWLK